MNLFKRESGENEKSAKNALVSALLLNTEKYIITQKRLNDALISSEGCTPCKIMKFTNKMAKLHTQSREICACYELLFNKEINVDKMIQIAIDKHYPMLNEAMNAPLTKSGRDSEGFNPMGKSDSEIRTAIIEALAKTTGVDPSDIKIAGGPVKRGVLSKMNPGDFDSPEDFLNAAVSLSEAEDGKSGEQIITENIMRNTEASVESAKERAKSSPKAKVSVSSTEKKPKTDA